MLQAVAENQPFKNRMNSNAHFSGFVSRLSELIRCADTAGGSSEPAVDSELLSELALALFELQFTHNAPYRQLCESRRVVPPLIETWQDIPSVPTTAFKEREMSCI